MFEEIEIEESIKSSIRTAIIYNDDEPIIRDEIQKEARVTDAEMDKYYNQCLIDYYCEMENNLQLIREMEEFGDLL